MSKRQRAEKSSTKESSLTRAQARKMLIDFIEPTLLREGFNQRKGSTFWRVTELKSDVIEVRLSTPQEADRACIPESSFSIWAGSYFSFMPNIYDESSLHKIDDLLTPEEAFCHFRVTVQRGIKQARKTAGENMWCLTGVMSTDEVELNDALSQVEKTIIPELNNLYSLQNWIDLLASEKINIGFGAPDSSNRNLFLGCAFLRANNLDGALEYLKRAQVQSQEFIERMTSAVRIEKNSPLFREQEFLRETVSRLASNEQSTGAK